jgi:hypothetical protein
MKFRIGTILSITHGRLLTSVDELYKILNYMVDDNLYTHQLPRAGRFCEPFIKAQYPELEEKWIYNDEINTENWREYVKKAEEIFGKELEIEKTPAGVWSYKDPIEEACEMVGKEKVISVEI